VRVEVRFLAPRLDERCGINEWLKMPEGFGRNGDSRRQRFIERNVAFAAVAATAAALANVNIAGILRAEGANARGLLLADAAGKRH